MSSKQGEDLNRRNITIIDSSECAVDLTLWQDFASKFDESILAGNPIIALNDFGERLGFKDIAFFATTPKLGTGVSLVIKTIILPIIPSCVQKQISPSSSKRLQDLVALPKIPLPPTFIDPIDLSRIINSPFITQDLNLPSRFTLEGDFNGNIYTNLIIEDARSNLSGLFFQPTNINNEIKFILGKYACGDDPCGVEVSSVPELLQTTGSLNSDQNVIRLQVWEVRGLVSSNSTSSTLLIDKDFSFDAGEDMSVFKFDNNELIVGEESSLFVVPISKTPTTEFLVKAIPGNSIIWSSNDDGSGIFNKILSNYSVPPNTGLEVPVYYDGYTINSGPQSGNGSNVSSNQNSCSGIIIPSGVKTLDLNIKKEITGRGNFIFQIANVFTYTSSMDPASEKYFLKTIKTIRINVANKVVQTGANSATRTINEYACQEFQAEEDIILYKLTLKVIKSSKAIYKSIDGSIDYNQQLQNCIVKVDIIKSETVLNTFGDLDIEHVLDPNAVIVGSSFINYLDLKNESSVVSSLQEGDKFGTAEFCFSQNGLILPQGRYILKIYASGCDFLIYQDAIFNSSTGLQTRPDGSLHPLVYLEFRPHLVNGVALRDSKEGFGFIVRNIDNINSVINFDNTSNWWLTNSIINGSSINGSSVTKVFGPSNVNDIQVPYVQTSTNSSFSPTTGSPLSFELDYISTLTATSNSSSNTTTTTIELIATNPVRLTINNGQDQHPRLCIDSNNNLWVVWFSDRSGTNEIYLAKYSGQCGVWSTHGFGGHDLKLTNFAQFNGQASFANVFADSSGEVHITFQANKENENSQIYYIQSTGGGSSFLDPIQLTSSTGNALMPDICVTKDNRVVVLWHDNRFNDINFEIMSCYKTQGIWHSSNQGFVDQRITNAVGNSLFSRIYPDNNGNVKVVYQDERNGTNNVAIYMDIYLASIQDWICSGNGGVDIKVSNGPLNSIHPDIAIDKVNGVFIVWDDDRLSLQDPSQHEQIFGTYCPIQQQDKIIQQCFPPIEVPSSGINNVTNQTIYSQIDWNFKILSPKTNKQITFTDNTTVNLIIDAPGATFYRVANEDGIFSDWIPVAANFDLNTTITSWTLTCSIGTKKVCVQIQDEKSVSLPKCTNIDLITINPTFTIDFFYDSGFLNPLPMFQEWPATSFGEVFIKITSSMPLVQSPTFDVIGRGLYSIFNQNTTKIFTIDTQNTNGTTASILPTDATNTFLGRFTIKKQDGIYNVDGLSRVIVHGINDCGELI